MLRSQVVNWFRDRGTARVAGASACLIGTMVVTGWATGIETLTSLHPRYIAMLPNTAVGMILAGCAIMLLAPPTTRARVRAARALTLLVLWLGVASFLSRVLGREILFIGELFRAQVATHPYRPVGLMATNSAVAFMLAAIALLLLSSTAARRRHLGRILAIVGGAIAMVALLGHVYGARSLFAIDRAAGMALVTAIGFAAVHGGILFLRSTDPGISLVSGGDLAGRVTRRLLPVSIAFPVLTGVAWLAGREQSWYSRETGLALFVVFTVMWVITISLYNAHLIRDADMARTALLEREQAARSAAESASKAKSDFLAVMSHELRTPLNAIVGYAELLTQRIAGPVTDGQEKQLVRIRDSARHLTRVVDDILTLSRLDAGKDDAALMPVHLPALFEEVRGILEPLAHAKSLRCDITCDDVTFETDPHRLRQILINLGGNAIKFTSAGSVGIVGRHFGNDGDGAVVVDVTDTGIGISAQHLDRVFEEFWQAEHPLKRNHGGTGLGLPLSRRLARLLGGDITVESRPGLGSTFRIRLPARATPGAAANTAAPAIDQPVPRLSGGSEMLQS